jgi:hypothetical protein
MHLLVGPDVYQSIVAMRIVNGCLAILLIGAVVVSLAAPGRRLVAYAALPVCVPLMVYLVASVNPSGWAITGVLVAWFGTYAAASATSRWREVVAVVAVVLGAAMAASARADAGAFLVVAALTVSLLNWTQLRAKPWKLALPVVTSLFGVVGFLSATQSQALESGMDMSPDYAGGDWALFMGNVLNLPRLLIDYTAAVMGLNWVDTPMPPLVWVPVVVVSLALLFLGLGSMEWRKGLALAAVTLVYIGLPLYLLQRSGYHVGESVQPRYLVPLLPLLVALALWRPRQGGASRLSAVQTSVVFGCLTVAHAVALHTQIRRFTVGLDVFLANLDHTIEWWHTGPSPMVTWVIGSLGFAALASVLFLVGRAETDDMQVGTGSGARVTPELAA